MLLSTLEIIIGRTLLTMERYKVDIFLCFNLIVLFFALWLCAIEFEKLSEHGLLTKLSGDIAFSSSAIQLINWNSRLHIFMVTSGKYCPGKNYFSLFREIVWETLSVAISTKICGLQKLLESKEDKWIEHCNF